MMFKRMLFSFGLLMFIIPLHGMAPVAHVTYDENQDAILAWIRIDGIVTLAHVMKKDLKSNQYTYFQTGNNELYPEIAINLKKKIAMYEKQIQK